MEKILICPGERPAVGFLAQSVPLVVTPILGENLLQYWVESLADRGVKSIVVLATDRPELVRSAVGDGSRWGLRIRVDAAMSELTPDQATTILRHGGNAVGLQEMATPNTDPTAESIVLDHLPGMDDMPMFRSYKDWFSGVLAWIPKTLTGARIGIREISPGVWCGLRTQIASSAKLRSPCWLGEHVRVGPDALIGPSAILEDRVVVDSAAEILSSAVGPDTFVGTLTKLEGSIAWGSTLIDWRSGSCTQVPDPFLLCSLAQRYPAENDHRFGQGGRRGFWRSVIRPWELIAQLPERLRL